VYTSIQRGFLAARGWSKSCPGAALLCLSRMVRVWFHADPYGVVTMSGSSAARVTMEWRKMLACCNPLASDPQDTMAAATPDALSGRHLQTLKL